jgi:hypothetical protein
VAVKSFYDNPSEATQQVAKDAVLNYRRTFPDTDRGTLQVLSEKIECGETRECQLLRERKNNEHIALVGQIGNKYVYSLSAASMEFRAKIVTDLAMERRLHGDVPLAWINMDHSFFKNEKDLAALRERFFKDIDRAARNEGATERELLEYLSIYAQAAEKTFKAVKPGRICPLVQAMTEDGRQCARSVSEITQAFASRDRAIKVAAAKKAITERDAPLDMLRQSVSQIFR